jgi:hypothetical protein
MYGHGWFRTSDLSRVKHHVDSAPTRFYLLIGAFPPSVSRHNRVNGDDSGRYGSIGGDVNGDGSSRAGRWLENDPGGASSRRRLPCLLA